MTEVPTIQPYSAVIASGWQYDLAELEFATLAASDSNRNVIHQRVTLCQEQTAKLIASRSALVTETLSPVSHIKFSDHEKNLSQIVEWCEENLDKERGTIAVRADKIGIKLEGWSSRKTEQSVGGALHRAGWKIDLTEPDITLRIYALNHNDSRNPQPSLKKPLLVFGVKFSGTSPWDERTAPKRPYFKPISLDPRVGRAMANLACPEGGKLLDPFCGTGGILMEGAGSGLQVFGSDADSRMVWGTRENLEWAARNSASGAKAEDELPEIRRGSATNLAELWQDEAPFDGFSFDPPYGRNSWKSDDGWQLFIDALSSCSQVSNAGNHSENGNNSGNKSRLTTLLPWPPAAAELDLMAENFGSNKGDSAAVTFERSWLQVRNEIRRAGWQVIQTISIPVHRSLARLLLICESVPSEK